MLFSGFSLATTQLGGACEPSKRYLDLTCAAVRWCGFRMLEYAEPTPTEFSAGVVCGRPQQSSDLSQPITSCMGQSCANPRLRHRGRQHRRAMCWPVAPRYIVDAHHSFDCVRSSRQETQFGNHSLCWLAWFGHKQSRRFATWLSRRNHLSHYQHLDWRLLHFCQSLRCCCRKRRE